MDKEKAEILKDLVGIVWHEVGGNYEFKSGMNRLYSKLEQIVIRELDIIKQEERNENEIPI